MKKAVEQGQVPRSRLLTGGAASAATLCTALAFAPEAGAALTTYARSLLTASGDLSPTAALIDGAWVLARVTALPLTAGLLAAVVAAAAGSGLHLHPNLAAPKLERLDPIAGTRRLFSAKQLGEVARGFVVCGVLGYVGWTVIRDEGPAVLSALRAPTHGAAASFLEPLTSLVLRLTGVLAVLAIADYALALRRHLLDLRMTKQEVKQEHKDSEGDPRHRAHRKAMHRQLAGRGPARGVHKATAVVVNPTHIAVALRYAPEECDAPYLVARGRDADALAIRRAAKSLGVPVVKDVPLARSLIHFDVGEEIPEELYRAAAAVLHAASQLEPTDPRPVEETP